MKINIALAQLNFLVGGIDKNADLIIEHSLKARDQLHADVVVFPELAICGYPAEDLLFRKTLYQRSKKAIEKILKQVQDIIIIFGYPENNQDHLFNAAMVIHNGQVIANYHKQKLPNYSVFDEKRYFKAGQKPCVINIKGMPTAILICEDTWFDDIILQAKHAGAKCLISLNASPFHSKKHLEREQIFSDHAKLGQMPILYVNLVGGQDELVFDGDSIIFDKTGKICQRGNAFSEEILLVEIDFDGQTAAIKQQNLPRILTEIEAIYGALVLGLRDYVFKNHFRSIVIGLSGGIDSALTLALAVDAIGAENVHAVLMPSPYTAKMSIEDAIAQANNLSVKYSIIPIDEAFQAMKHSLSQEFQGLAEDITEENLQARIRGMILMAISNKKGDLVVSTGNKSEMSVGYSTLYGDLVGGFAVLKDVPKILVYQLVAYRNAIQAVIPQRVITRAPSAELKPQQTDQDSLPPYEILDQILYRYIELDEPIGTTVAAGFDRALVEKIAKMVKHSEYKRRQSPPGVRISKRAFGRDRRYPITSGF